MSYTDSTNEKLKAAAEYGEHLGSSALHNDACCDTKAPTPNLRQAGNARQYPENVIVGLRSRAEVLRGEARQVSRITSILEKHPEFLDFLEVLRSGLV